MMSNRFNLLDEPWIPVRLTSGAVDEVGLLALFDRLGEITALAETSPPSLVALHRLLLAVTHRALFLAQGPWRDKDRAQWYRDGLPVDVMRKYLEQWRDRFWLFHLEHPFMQVAALAQCEETRDKTKPWTQIALDRVSGNAPVLFDHSVDGAPTAIDAAQALRYLLGFLQFVQPGLVQVIKVSDNAGPLANSAAAIPLGDNMNQTICLALHGADRRSGDDLPTWEQAAPRIVDLAADARLATGPNDRYTRQSRAVLLMAEENDVQVRVIRFGAGAALKEDSRAPDPMTSYRVGSKGLVRISFREGRAIWRDLSSLLADPRGQHASPASVLGWASNLKRALGQDRSNIPVLVAGVTLAIGKLAKIERWRAESFALPANLLLDPEAAQVLRTFLVLADSFFERVSGIAAAVIADSLPDSNSKDTRSRAREMLNRSPCEAAFFSTAERALPDLMRHIGEDALEEADALWRQILLTASSTAWEIVRRSLGFSSAALRAEAIHRWKLDRLLRELRGDAGNGVAPPIPPTSPSSQTNSKPDQEVHS
jgi:CRISPR system Cascade subunit CasA